MNWLLRPLSDFERYARNWDELNRERGNLPFLRAAFLRPLIREFASGKELLALHAADGRPRAMTMLAPKSRGVWETFQPSQLPLGAWLLAPEINLDAASGALLKALPGLALSVGVTQQDPLLLPRPESTGRSQTLDYIHTAWVEVSGSFEAYWEQRGKNLRHNMRKQRAKLQTEGIDTKLEVLSKPEEVAAAIVEYGALESAGWKAEGGSAIHPDNAQGRFYRAMLEEFCAQDAARIYRYRFADQVVAVDLCVESEHTQVILKTTYDEAYKSYSPAFLMRQESFKQIFDEGRIQRIEFYGKMMEWHARWTEHSRTLYHLNRYRWSFVPRLRSLLSGRRAEAAPAVLAQQASGSGEIA